jgi:hypothetical protein
MLRDLERYAGGARLVTSPLQLGEWLAQTFAGDIVERRRGRERAVAALEQGAPVVVEVVDYVGSVPAPEEVRPPVATPDASPRALAAGRRVAALATVVVVLVALALAFIVHARHAIH